MEVDRASIVASAVAKFRLPQATLTHATPTAALEPPVVDVPHAEWRGLPDDIVARVLSRLPILDLFRIGYLFSPRWLDIWRALPLYLHDRQFASPLIAADDVADAIANVLELYVGDGVQFVGVQGGGESDDGDGGGSNEVAGADGDDLGVIVNPWGARGGGVVDDDDDDDDGDDHDGGLDVGEDEAADQDGGVVVNSEPGVAVADDVVELEDGAADQGGGVVDDPDASADQDGEGVVHRPRFPGGIGADDGIISDEELYGNDDIPDGGYEIGRVYSFRVETTGWRLDHLDRWFAALQRGRAREVTLANLAIEGKPDLPPAIRDCTSLLGLHVFFFTVEADHIAPLVKLRSLGLYGCTSNYGIIAPALRPQSEIRKLVIDSSELGDVAVVTTRLRSLVMYDNLVEGTVTVDDAIQFRNLHLYPTRPSRVSINDAPSLRSIAFLDLFNTVLEIKGIVIQAGIVQHSPKMCSVRCLGLRVNYTEMGDRVPREIEQILRCFPCLEKLVIRRDDEVTEAEGLLEANDEHIYEGNNFFDGIYCINNHLWCIYFTGSRGGKYELALVKAILDKVQAGTHFKMIFSPSNNNIETISDQLNLAIENFRMTTPNDAVRNEDVSIIFSLN